MLGLAFDPLTNTISYLTDPFNPESARVTANGDFSEEEIQFLSKINELDEDEGFIF